MAFSAGRVTTLALWGGPGKPQTFVAKAAALDPDYINAITISVASSYATTISVASSAASNITMDGKT